MPTEPFRKKAIVFIDGQNLFHAIKDSFGYQYPNYNIKLLADSICKAQGWELKETRFYTGIPDVTDNAFWHHFWTNKLASMGQRGITVFKRKLHYRNQTVSLPNGSQHTFLVGQEKGIDVRLAIDVIKSAHEGLCDCIIIFSQDQDLSEVADEIRKIVVSQDRWIKICSAFPSSPTAKNKRGINKTDWIKIDRAAYDQCIDLNDYRPGSSTSS
jgi:uncharacterized LabA/DUF88 family protein